MIKKASYENIIASQIIGTFDFFRKLIDVECFDVVIEIGTAKGALSLFLADNFNIPIYSYDILIPESIDKFKLRSNLFFKNKDVFEDVDLIEMFKSQNKVLLLCDGGNKIKEFNYFSDFLTVGDFIMAHDYFESKRLYDKSKWGSCEIVFNDIKDSCNRNNIKKVYKKSKDFFWFCGQKKGDIK